LEHHLTSRDGDRDHCRCLPVPGSTIDNNLSERNEVGVGVVLGDEESERIAKEVESAINGLTTRIDYTAREDLRPLGV
jgi:2-keto-4-pentenoate hydratase/2-oxohepta-3-ene-1,7-dioic acid hydratase in catechol pathway